MHGQDVETARRRQPQPADHDVCATHTEDQHLRANALWEVLSGETEQAPLNVRGATQRETVCNYF